MANFRITKIDNEVWRNFKTLAAWKGETCRDILIDFISKEASTVKDEKAKQTTLDKIIGKVGKRI